MNNSALKLIILLVTVFAHSVFAASPAGTWTTKDAKTGKKRALITLHEYQNNLVTGTIAKVFPQPGDTGICSKCPGKFKDAKIQGLEFLWGLKRKSENEWAGGHILDPKTGKIYHVQMTLQGNKLYVRGFRGIAILGSTQVWKR